MKTDVIDVGFLIRRWRNDVEKNIAHFHMATKHDRNHGDIQWQNWWDVVKAIRAEKGQKLMWVSVYTACVDYYVELCKEKRTGEHALRDDREIDDEA